MSGFSLNMEGTARHLTGFGSHDHIWTAASKSFMNLGGLPHVPVGLLRRSTTDMGPAGESISAPKSIRLHYNVAVLTTQIERAQRRTIVSLANSSQNRQGKCLALEPSALA